MSRQTGNLPISIGSSVCFESMKSPPTRQFKDKVNRTNKLVISVDTLARNLLGACRGEQPSTSEMEVYITQEMETIEEVASQLPRKPSVLFYSALTNDFPKVFQHAIFREKTTKQQEGLNQIEDIVAIAAKTTTIVKAPYFDLSFDCKNKDSIIIMTHKPHELLRFTAFDDVTLIESHTATVKTKGAWYTKLNDGKKLPPIPFNAGILQIFGDTVLFRQQPKAMAFILNVAKMYRWHGLTDTERMRDTLRKTNPGKGEDKNLALRLMEL